MNDDLDLEGNWASGSPSRGGGDADDDEATEVVGATAAAAAEKGQKRKKKASSAAASGEKPAKVSKKASAASKKHESKSTQGAEGSADADDGEGPAKKKEKIQTPKRRDEICGVLGRSAHEWLRRPRKTGERAVGGSLGGRGEGQKALRPGAKGAPAEAQLVPELQPRGCPSATTDALGESRRSHHGAVGKRANVEHSC
mmetsp:Transcript_45019/g.97102  ORF Transcript_45019/g.97102 Transcript_45019/m.97102 type:complete len:199 (-) Transcript_45019:783-1379(-)